VKHCSGALAAQANLSVAKVKRSGRSHKRAAEKEREWQREKQRLMKESR
jgi:tmRNA-binding protein